MTRSSGESHPIIGSRKHLAYIKKIMNSQTENTKWVIQNSENLIQANPEKYIAVRNEEVIASNEKLEDIVNVLSGKYDNTDDVVIKFMTETPIGFLL